MQKARGVFSVARRGAEKGMGAVKEAPPAKLGGGLKGRNLRS